MSLVQKQQQRILEVDDGVDVRGARAEWRWWRILTDSHDVAKCHNTDGVSGLQVHILGLGARY
jgi:hypothetical protein